MSEILYHETLLNNDPTIPYTDTPNEIEVILSYWETETHYLPRHYLLHSKVTLDNKFIVDEVELICVRWTKHAEMIRKAVTKCDHLKILYPACCEPDEQVQA